MPDQVDLAADRLREAAEQAVWQWQNHDRYRHTEAERGTPLVVDLAHAYLALLAARPAGGDGEPAGKWFGGAGFDDVYNDGRVFMLKTDRWKVVIRNDGLEPKLFLNSTVVCTHPTRGHVRRLCEAIGIPIPPDADAGRAT